MHRELGRAKDLLARLYFFFVEHTNKAINKYHFVAYVYKSIR
jgi:hypothetical protein